jgi:translation initiation factor SUI1
MPEPQTEENPIEVRVQRARRGWVTIVAGLNPEINFKRVTGEFKSSFGCNGSVQIDKEQNKYVLFQGNMCENLKNFLVSQRIAKLEAIKVVGV